MPRSRFQLWSFVAALLLFSSAPCFAQVQVGTPPFGSYAAGPDSINLGNLNAHLTIPIVQKAGRGTNFPYYLNLDSSVWAPVGSSGSQTWQPDGLQIPLQYGSSAGHIYQQIVTVICPNPNYPPTLPKTLRGVYLTNYHYVDVYGVGHPFNVTWENDGCQNTGPVHGVSTDGSGYTISVNSSGIASVTDRNGNLFSPPVATGTGAASMTDSNGNQITESSSGVITDTLGTTALTISGSSPTTFTYTTPNGDSAVYTATYTSETVKTNFGCSGIAEFGPTTESLLSSITLPDGTAYTFTYEHTPGFSGDVTGRLASIMLPTGGTISYTYSGGSNGITCADGSTATLGRATPDGSWTYAHSESGTAWTTTITDPQSNDTTMNFQGIYETERQVNQGASTLMKTTNTCYNGNITISTCNSTAITLPITQRTTFVSWPGSSALQSRSDNVYNILGLLTGKTEYAYGSNSPGSPVRQSAIVYATLGGGISNRPSSVTVTGGGATVAQTLYTYDSSPLTSVSGIAQHNDASYGTSDTVRGNLTKVQSLVSGTTFLTSSATYDTTGQRLTTTDPAGNVVTLSYADSFFTDNGANPPLPFTPSAPTNAYVTKMTDPILGAVGTFGYYIYTGDIAASVDQNGADSYAHYDSAGRISSQYTAKLQSGNRGWVSFQYPNTRETDAYTSITSTVAASNCTSCRHDQTIFDNQGRTTSEVLASDPDGATTINTTYDSLGRVSTRTNPYRSTSDPTYGIETKAYDGMSRTIKVTHADGSVAQTLFGSAVGAAGGAGTQLCLTTTYGMGYPVLSVDPSSKKRQLWVDALGRAIEVDESDSSGALTVPTCYIYDAGNNVTQIVQGTETRSYSYDGLSRLVLASSPETGSNSYSYTTAAGALCGGSSLLICRKTDARGITTTNSYDALSRITSTVYSDGATPEVQYFYDQSTFDGLTISGGKGRLTGLSDGSGESAFSYDLLGDVSAEVHTVSGISKTSSYTYNLDQSIASLTYPSGRQLAYSYSNAERTLSVIDSTSGLNYVSAAVYAPPGSLASMVFGKSSSFAGITENFTHNNRLQLSSQLASSVNGTVLNLSYGFPNSPGNNDHGTSFANNLDNGRSVSTTYDPLNRLSSAQSQATSGADCWGQSFGYDRWGNLSSIGVLKCTGSALSLSVTNNRITTTGFTYNASGDITNDASNAYTYDAEQRLTSAPGVTYTYDGRDLRVKKSNGTIYWRGFLGDAVSESDLAGNITSDYIFFDSQRAARIDSSGNVYFYLTDKLGSTRAITTSSGALCYAADFTPFGGELAFSNNCPQNYKFTGYERDSETGLDYTFYRHYSSRLGRFLQPDVLGGSLTAPQSLNRYAYVLNDPCTMTDPLGLSPCSLNILVNNNVNLTATQKTAIQNQINAIFGPDVVANFNFSGVAQFALNVNNAGPGVDLDVLGISYHTATGNFVWANHISKLFALASATHAATIMGTMGAHELFHAITNTDDVPFSGNAPTDLMAMDYNPDGTLARNQLNHNVLALTPKERAALLAACQAHPSAGVNKPSSQNQLSPSPDAGGAPAVYITGQPDNSSVTTSQQDDLPAPCTDGTLTGCTVTGYNDTPDSGDGADPGTEDPGAGDPGGGPDPLCDVFDCFVSASSGASPSLEYAPSNFSTQLATLLRKGS